MAAPMGASGGSQKAAPSERARELVKGYGTAGFAVLDGARFADLPAQIKTVDLFARSLFLHDADPEVQRAGPWLVKLAQEPDAVDKVFALVGNEPAAVFWRCDGGKAVLLRHLRGLNMVRIPKWAADGDLAPRHGEADEELALVFFRHFDPRVLGALLPVLNAAHLARFLGAADEASFVAPDHGGLKRLRAEQRPALAGSGFLTLGSHEMEAFADRRDALVRQRTILYLRQTRPDILPPISDEDMEAFVVDCRKSGTALGLSTQAAHCRWAYLMMMTEGRITRHPEALRYVSDGLQSPDAQIESLIGHLAHYVKFDLPRDIGR